MSVRLWCRGVLLDNDGVLVDSHHQVTEAWTEIARLHDLDVERLLTELVGVRAYDTLSQHLSPQEAEQAVAVLERLEVGTADATKAVAGAAALLDRLPADRYAIVTSASRRLAEARWAGAGIAVPPVVVTAEDVFRGKPHPEPFLVGAAGLGIDPADCVIFEDSPSGGRAAVATGAVVVAVGDQPWDVEPTARVPDLTAVTVEAVDTSAFGRRPGRLELRLHR